MEENRQPRARNWWKITAVVLSVLIIVPLAFGAYIYYSLPRLPGLLVPKDPITPSTVAEASTPVGNNTLRDRVTTALRSAVQTQKTAEITLSQKEITYLLNKALTQGDDAHNQLQGAIVEFSDGMVHLLADYRLDENLIGIQAALTPRLDGDQLRLSVSSVTLGKIPIPVAALSVIMTRFPVNTGSSDISLEGNTVVVDLGQVSTLLAQESGIEYAIAHIRSENGELAIGIQSEGQ